MGKIYKMPFDWDYVDDNTLIYVDTSADGIKAMVDSALGEALEDVKAEVVDETISTMDIKLEGENLLYKLLVKGDDKGEINIPKDQFLKSASYDKDNKKLIFVMETTDGEKTTEVNISELVEAIEEKNSEQDASLDTKADKTEVDSALETINTKNTEQDAAIEEKAVKADVESALALKADKTELEPLAKSADVTAEIAAAVEPLATKEEVNAIDGKLADYATVEALNAEIERATAKENEVTEALNVEAQRATAAESELEGKVTAEQARAEAKEAELVAKDEAQDAEIALKADKTELEPLAKSADVTAEIAAAVEPLATKEELTNAAAEAVAKVVAEAPEDFDTLKEVADYIASDKTKATEIENKLSEHDAAVEALNAKDGELEAAIVDEATRATAAESELTGKVVAEQARAEAKEAELAAKDDAQDAEIAKKVDWVESTPGRNHIVLKNHDSVLGTATDGSTYNLAMVSKWDVADFGSAQLHANLNSKDGSVTINDDKVVATKDEVESVDAKVNAIDLTPFAKTEDMNAAVEALNAKDTELEAAIPQAAADAVAQVVANAPEDLDTLKKVADYIAADKTKAAEIENKLAELTAKDEAQDAEIALKADKTELEPLAKSADVTAEIAAAVSVLNTKDEAQDAEIALKADSDKVYTKEDVNNTLEGYVPVEQYNDLKARLDNLEIMMSVYNAEREAQMDEIISNMSSDNKELVIDTLMESIVVPETTVAYTITAPLTDNSTVELTSPKYMTLINTSKEPVSTTISHEYVEGESTSATKVYLVGNFDTLTLENITPSVKSGYDAASVKNVVIGENNVKDLSLNLDFQDGATITNNSDKDITIYDMSDSAIALTVVAPNSTVTLSSGQFTTLNAEVSDNTLIIKKNIHIDNLNLTKGNAIVEVARAEEVAGIVENYTVADGYSVSHRIYHITNENSSKLGGIGEMILDEDITRTSSIVAPLAPAYDAVWNLNGHNITVEGTPKSGVYLNRYASNLEVKGEGVIRAEGGYGLWNAATSGKIIINDGVTIEAQTHAVYAEKGVIEINGGTFKLTNWETAEKDENGNLRFLINCLDANYRNGSANIIVKGGKFYDFDPSNCAAEGVGTSFVAEGYGSVMATEVIDGVEHKVFEVKPING